MKEIVLLLLLSASLVWSADIPAPDLSAYGRLILTPFATAPFPHPSRAKGHLYDGTNYDTATHYSDSTVALFIPKGFRATPRVDFVIHFHGWRNTVAGTLQQFQLAEQLTASGRNAILIVPEGPHNAPDSAGGKLEDSGGFQRFLAEAMAVLQQNNVISNDAIAGRIILSGHSGGYRVMAAILDRGGLTDHIREVWLFDALYASSDSFLQWAAQGPNRLLDIYTDHGGTLENSEAMIATLRQNSQTSRTLIATNETSLNPADLGTHRYVFLHSDQVHNDVVSRHKTFQLFLETSCLSPGKPRT
jgi:hypothetical protein